MIQLIGATLIAGLVVLSSGSATAQQYPTKPIRLIVAFPPGGSTDIIARVIGQKLGERLGQQVVIDNRGGAGGTLRYDPTKDFAPITLVAITPYLLVVNPGVQAKTLKEFISLVKEQAGKLNYASAGNGTTTHLAMEMLKSVAALDIVHVPFNGNAPAGTAVLGGQVQALFGSMPAVLPHAKSGKVRALAVGTAKRSPSLPDVPSVAESGYPGYEASLWL